MLKWNKKTNIILVVIVVMSLASCKSERATEVTQEANINKVLTVEVNQPKDINETPIMDDISIYANNNPLNVVYFYVTVRQGKEGTDTNHTFAEVNNVKKFVNHEHIDVEVKADALLQVGDEAGPLENMLGYGETSNNATIEIRGNSTSLAAQKSYSIKLYDQTSLWRGQKKIALVKSVYDATRFRNKLYFDLLIGIPDIPSLRTQFVQLLVKDETASMTDYVDYGLFTQIEVPDKKYLNNHGLDGSGYLYKVRSFNFEPNKKIKNFDDPQFNLAEFETVLTCSGKEDNHRLIEMILALNDDSIDIDTVIDTYFDRDNYLTWLAYNILMGNTDTVMQNFYLYSPLNGDKWYFIPWDGDGSLLNYEYEVKSNHVLPSWESGISNYWRVILHQKFLSIGSNREQLTKKIEMLKNEYLTEDKVMGLVTQYESIMGNYTVSMPDLSGQTVTIEQRQAIVHNLYHEIEHNYTTYYESLEGLMPFFLNDVTRNDDTVHFSWGESYDMQGKLVNYTFFLSTIPDFSNVIFEEEDIRTFTVDKVGLEPGEYYWKVIASTDDGRSVTAFNSIYVEDVSYDGIERVIIE